MGPLTRLVLASLPHVPKPVMRRFASRYIAGETLDQAFARLMGLHDAGFAGILDLLGEDVKSEEHARAVMRQYALAATHVRRRGLDAYISVKPTHFGLRLSERFALGLYSELAAQLARLGVFLRVEMEDATTTDATLRVFEALRAEHDNVGVVLQARLFRTLADIEHLAPGPLDVRLVKGIYLEPAAIAHTDPDDIRGAMLACSAALLERGAYVGYATHDEALFDAVRPQLARHSLGRDDYEIQVLLGVQEPLWQRWHAEGHRVRVYVPYGPEWRAYSLRRMRKNPHIVGHVLRGMLTSLAQPSGPRFST